MVACKKCRSRKFCAKRAAMRDGDPCGLFVSDKKPLRLPKSHECSWETSKGLLVRSFGARKKASGKQVWVRLRGRKIVAARSLCERA